MLHTATIELPTTRKEEMIDVTKRVRAVVTASSVQSGLCSIYCGHTTGAITLNENTDPDVQTDILNALERAVPAARSITSTRKATPMRMPRRPWSASPRPSRCRAESSRSGCGRRSTSASSTARGTGSWW